MTYIEIPATEVAALAATCGRLAKQIKAAGKAMTAGRLDPLFFEIATATNRVNYLTKWADKLDREIEKQYLALLHANARDVHAQKVTALKRRERRQRSASAPQKKSRQKKR